MTPSLAFFQAAATAIPALMIALAVGMRRGHIAAEQSSAKGAMPNFLLMLGLSVAVALGEIVALLVLAAGEVGPGQGFAVYMALVLALAQVVYELTMPTLNKVPSKVERRLGHGMLFVLTLAATLTGAAVLK